jgi:hypothetical protein
MRKYWPWVMVLAAALAIGVAAKAIAGTEKPIVVRAGNLILKLNGGASPKALPRAKLAPVTIHASARIATVDGSQPPALKEFILDTGPTGVINSSGVPVCRTGRIEATTTAEAERACSSSIVGKGSTAVRVAFPESTPFSAKGPLVIFNGGSRGNRALILIHAYVNVPAPTAIVETVVVTKEHDGPYNLHSAGTIPVIAGGSGVVTSFELTINRPGYLLASCSDGKFFAHVVAVFRGGTELMGSFIRPCTRIG